MNIFLVPFLSIYFILCYLFISNYWNKFLALLLLLLSSVLSFRWNFLLSWILQLLKLNSVYNTLIYTIDKDRRRQGKETKMNSLEFVRLLAIRLLLSQHDHMNLLYSQGIEKVQSKSIRMLYQYTKKYMKME